MHPKQTERFFRVLAKELPHPATIIVTGAAAGSLWGHIRPSLDIDFAIMPAGRRKDRWTVIERAVERTIRLTGIAANYAEDIDRWSAISLLDYRRHSLPYQRFGSLNVRLMDPAYWSIGKLSRFLDPDVQDLVAVLKRRRIPARSLVRLWARAIRHSPASAALSQFCKQAEYFIRTFGPAIWGTSFDSSQVIHQFHRALRPSSSLPSTRQKNR